MGKISINVKQIGEAQAAAQAAAEAAQAAEAAEVAEAAQALQNAQHNYEEKIYVMKQKVQNMVSSGKTTYATVQKIFFRLDQNLLERS